MLKDQEFGSPEQRHGSIESKNNVNNDEYKELENDDQEEEGKKKNAFCTCLMKKCIIISIISVILFLVVTFLFLYFMFLPSLVQDDVDNTTMDIINGTIYNPTNNSIDMNTTIKIQNSGGFKAEIGSSINDVYIDNIYVGYMHMPSITTEANKPSIATISTRLYISNVTQFQHSCKQLLLGHDQYWNIKSKNNKLKVHINNNLKYNTNVNIDKILTLPSSNLEDFISYNFDVLKATPNTLYTKSDITFRSNSILTFQLPSTLMNIYIGDEYIGQSNLDPISMNPGKNAINGTIMQVIKNNNNIKTIESFFSNYIIGKDQIVILKGPINNIVIDNIIEQQVIAKGSPEINLAFGGIANKVTLNGWDAITDDVNNNTNNSLVENNGNANVNDDNDDDVKAQLNMTNEQLKIYRQIKNKLTLSKRRLSSTKKVHVRGAYADMYNTLNVPLRMIKMESDFNLLEPIRYKVKMGKLFDYTCYDNYTTAFASMNIGYGIWKNNSTKTWVDFLPKSRTTYFVIAGPQSNTEPIQDDICKSLFGFSCCWASMTTAAACRDNPQLSKNADSQLNVDYISASIKGNITMLIDNQFQLTTYYEQSFFPFYFSYEVYAGFMEDMELKCSDFTFY